MKSYILTILNDIDIYLCTKIRPLWLRKFWSFLWIRKNEFHTSLSYDFEYLCFLSDRKDYEGIQIYLEEISKKRDLAHKQDLLLNELDLYLINDSRHLVLLDYERRKRYFEEVFENTPSNTH